MASIETRKTTGKIARYRVKWRSGGTRNVSWNGTTVDAPGAFVTSTLPVVEESPPVVTFALSYLERLVKPEPGDQTQVP